MPQNSRKKISWDRQWIALPEGAQHPSQLNWLYPVKLQQGSRIGSDRTEDLIRRRSAAPALAASFLQTGGGLPSAGGVVRPQKEQDTRRAAAGRGSLSALAC